MKRALLVGIDAYDSFNGLSGCVNDVNSLKPLLARNEDNSPNFSCQERTTSSHRVTRATLLRDIDDLLAPGADVALLYFAGHGKNTPNDVILVTQDGSEHEPGIGFSVILAKVNLSPVRQIIIILDCCFSGGAGGVPQLGGDNAVLRHGVVLLTASRADQTSAEVPGGQGLFSSYLCGALDSGAADVLGKVTIAGIYAYLSESFGPWDQRPTFKANVDRLSELRQCSPSVPLDHLRCLPHLFPEPAHLFPLDPSYEPDAEPPHPEHERIFAMLQRCRAAKLVEPVDEEHMYFAAMHSTACRLTPLGMHYWHMAKQDRL